jgi:arylformamidase
MAGGEGVPAPKRHGSLPHGKGPLVFLDYTQAELDAAYDQAVYQPNIQQLRDRWASNSERTRHRIGAPERRAYGPGEVEVLDIFRTAVPSPARSSSLSMAAPGAPGWRKPMPLRPKCSSGRLPIMSSRISAGCRIAAAVSSMADQVRRAIAWVYRNAASFGGDPDRFYVGGHSSGAHLAAVALTTDWQRAFDLPPDHQGAGCAAAACTSSRPCGCPTAHPM